MYQTRSNPLHPTGTGGTSFDSVKTSVKFWKLLEQGRRKGGIECKDMEEVMKDGRYYV